MTKRMRIGLIAGALGIAAVALAASQYETIKMEAGSRLVLSTGTAITALTADGGVLTIPSGGYGKSSQGGVIYNVPAGTTTVHGIATANRYNGEIVVLKCAGTGPYLMDGVTGDGGLWQLLLGSEFDCTEDDTITLMYNSARGWQEIARSAN